MDPNPYSPPQTWSAAPCDVIDRPLRDNLADTIRRYLDEGIAAFQFDERLPEYARSGDSAIQFVVTDLQCYFDEFEVGVGPLSKGQWDYCHRLLLLLESDRGATQASWWRWSWTQVFAAAALLEFIMLAVYTGWEWRLGLAVIPLGIISMGLVRLRSGSSGGPYTSILYPFQSFAELKATLDTVGTFRKSRYPRPHPTTSRESSPILDAILLLIGCTIWLTLSPIALIAQAFPELETRTQVVG